ncbi:MAG: hypothetical protein P8R42_01220 [Candidatus Binatia bacterium]|nr:hypothetical protein [Candidatus Binatia bacterium]
MSSNVERPGWMTGMATLCAVAVVVLLVRDLFIPSTRDVEIWFGFEIHGGWARATAPIHWAIFAFGAWGFWTSRPWIVPLAAYYTFYGAFSHIVWSEVSPHGNGIAIGLIQAAAISAFGILLLRQGRSLR